MRIFDVTPRQSVVQLLRLQALLAFGAAALMGWSRDPGALVALGAGFAYVGFLRAYQRGWEYARHAMVIVVASVVVAFMREPYVTREASMAIALAPTLAAVLTSGRWVVAIAAAEYAGLLIRSGFSGVYLDAGHAVVFAAITVGLAFGRSILDAALHQARTQHERAVSARDEAERRAREVLAQRDRLALQAQLLDAGDQAVFACDAGGRIVYVNRAGRGFLHEPEPMGCALDELLPLYHPEQGRVTVSEASASVQDVNLVRSDGQRMPVLIARTPMLDDAGNPTGALVVCTDVSRIRRLEEELHHAQRLESIGRLAGGVAHDFNNLLTVIGGAATMAQRSLPADHAAQEDLEDVVVASTRAGELTRQLLAFARKQVLTKRTVDLSDLVTGMERMLRRVIGEHVTLCTRLSGDALLVNADPGQIEQVILNLVVNARDAMPQGGQLLLSTSEAEVEHEFQERRRYARLEVIDSGHGMTDEVQARIFEPFFTTKSAGRGTGLGLATCFGIVRQHEGQIRVASAPGRGTSMTVLLPRATEQAYEPITGVRTFARGCQRVVLVEDDEAVRRLMAAALRQSGYSVEVAANGKEGLLLLSQTSRVDVLVTDVVMPELGGPELARRARRLHPGLAVVLMSGYADARLGAEHTLPRSVFMQKPFAAHDLVHAIQAALTSTPPVVEQRA